MALRVTGYLGLDGSGFFQTMARADVAVKRFTSSVASGVAGQLAGLFSLGAMGAAMAKTIEYAGRLTDLSARTGVAVEALQRFDRAAKDNGSSLDALVSFWERLGTARQKALNDPNGGAAAAFGKLGVNQSDIQSASPQDLTQKISTTFKNTTNVNELIAPLREVGGRGAGELVAAFEAGMIDGLDSLSVITEEQADMLDELGDRWDTFKQELIVSLAPVIIWLTEQFKNIKTGFEMIGVVLVNMFEQIKNAFSTAFELVKALVSGKIMSSGDIAKKGFEQAKEIFKGGSQSIQDIRIDREQKDEEEAAARAARIAARRKRRSGTGIGNYEPDTEKKETFKISYDALTSVGNFLGANRMVLEGLTQKQVNILERIEKNTRAKKESSGASDDFSGL